YSHLNESLYLEIVVPFHDLKQSKYQPNVSYPSSPSLPTSIQLYHRLFSIPVPLSHYQDLLDVPLNLLVQNRVNKILPLVFPHQRISISNPLALYRNLLWNMAVDM